MSLIAKNIHKTFYTKEPLQVLQGIDLQVQTGSSVAIMGASGEGKTTLLHILGTLENFDLGELSIDQQNISKNTSLAHLRNTTIGFIFQSCNLLEDFSVLDNVLLPAKILRLSTKKNSEAYLKALKLLEDVSLKDKTFDLAKVLSGGEKQRVALARALMNDPKLILADEPTGNLDFDTSEKIHTLLMNSVKKLKKSLIVVTHDQELAKLCDEVFLLKKGKLSKLDKKQLA